jgi:membrane protease subunit HflC
MAKRMMISLAVAVVALLLWRSVYIIDQAQVGVRVRSGQIAGELLAPGLHWLSPLDDVRRFDQRVITHGYPSESFLTQDGQAVNVDYSISWRMNNPARFLQSTDGDSDSVAQRLSRPISQQLRAAVAAQPLSALPGAGDSGLNVAALTELRTAAQSLGVELLDLQLEHVDLTSDEANVLYQSMQHSLVAQAQQLRAAAASDAQKLRADADRKRADTLADATREAQHIRAQGDATAAETYARAYGRNPEFAAFYRSMQAYKSTLGRDGDILVISPEGEFFKYLHSASGR